MRSNEAENLEEAEKQGAPVPGSCRVCGAHTITNRLHQADRCTKCNFYYSLPSGLRDKIQHDDAVVMSNFKVAIHGIRERNFRFIIGMLKGIRPLQELSCLDVGCAYGHFLSILKPLAKSAIGIEPNEQMQNEARTNGVGVIPGFFPEDLPDGARFDLISFNDVLEHLPDPKAALEAASERLAPGGLLLISIPSSDGIVFKFSGVLAALSLRTLSDRVWQRQFYTPHISYFNRRNLSRLAQECGLTPLVTESLPVVESRSLYRRISVDTSLSPFRKVVLYSCGALYSLCSSVLPEEYFFTIFRREP